MAEPMDVRVEMTGAERIVPLRHAVLRAGLPVETARFAGDEAGSSRHWAAVDEAGRIVGCVTLHENAWEGRPAYQLRGMAVAAEEQHRGVGRALLRAAEAFVRGTGVGRMWCNARTPAAGFYEAHGWVVMSAVFEIPTAGPHVKMVREVGGSERG
ncbi:MAG TPA: GNAT family N-acetyltransferase [Phycisphaerae bacterium]|nr:GNAT family N-acetyltransferase [Phycisphaerae bacterium]